MTDFVYLLNLSAEENKRLKAENKRLREALEWYESCAYSMAWNYLEVRRATTLQELCADGGERAREALGDEHQS